MNNKIFLNSLYMEIYVIGYSSEGECILFLLRADDEVIYSGLVDCYTTSSSSVISDVLEEENIETLDIVLWTHPHDDHTKGLNDVINKYCDSYTKFVVTDILPNDLEAYSQEAQKVYTSIRNIHESKSKDKMEIVYVKNTTIVEKFNVTGNAAYLFEIKTFAPNSTCIAENKINNRIENGNLYSLGIEIDCGHFSVILGGDVENATINRLRPFAMNYPVDYVKIPHHGSDSSLGLVEFISQNVTIPPSVAVSTLYKRHNLPKTKVLNQYVHWGIEDVLTTSDIVCEENNKCSFGMVKTVFNILDNSEYPIQTYLYGNAIKYTIVKH